MAKDSNKKQVEQITDMEVDFAQWYTDVCKKAELIDYSSIKGMFIYRPYGYAIWENIQREMDRRFKETGHENVYQLAVRLFEKNPNRRALFASYLAKLGDPRALPVLIAAANEENCRYMDFIELRAAIEELGGEAPEREFYDDPEYEALHPMDDGDDDTPMQ